MVVDLSTPQSSDNSFKTTAASHSPEWVSSAAYVKRLSAERIPVHPAPDSTRFPLLNEKSGNSKTQKLPTPVREDCDKEGKENQRREHETTSLLGTARQSVFASLERQQKPDLKHSPRPPGVARCQSAKTLRTSPGTQLTCRWRKLSSRCLRTEGTFGEPGLSPVITCQSSFASSDDCNLPRIALDYTGGNVQRARSTVGLHSAAGKQRTQDQTPQGLECGAPQLFRSNGRTRDSDRISIRYDPGMCRQESMVNNWFLSVTDKDCDSVENGIAVDPAAEERSERPGNYNVTNERNQTKDLDVEDTAERGPPHDRIQKQGSLAPAKPAGSLSKRKLSPSVLLNPVTQRSFKNQRSLGTNNETRGINQSGGGKGEQNPSLDVEKTAMINKWLSDVSVKTADLKRGL